MSTRPNLITITATRNGEVCDSRQVPIGHARRSLLAMLDREVRAWGGHDGVSRQHTEGEIEGWDGASDGSWQVQAWNNGASMVFHVTGFPKPRPTGEPVGLVEIAERLGVARQTVDSWRYRGLLPAARWSVGGRSAWDWSLDIIPWARDTGRL